MVVAPQQSLPVGYQSPPATIAAGFSYGRICTGEDCEARTDCSNMEADGLLLGGWLCHPCLPKPCAICEQLGPSAVACSCPGSVPVQLGPGTTTVGASVLQHGEVVRVVCSEFSSELTGEVENRCDMGEVRQTGRCWQSCTPKVRTPAAFHHLTSMVTPEAAIAHGFTAVAACSALQTALVGTMVLSCTDGVLVADTHSCEGPACDATTVAGVEVASLADGQSVVLQGQCSQLEAGLSGDALVTCRAGIMRADRLTCAGGQCSAGYSEATLGETTADVGTPTLMHGALFTQPDGCAAINPRFSGDLPIRCGNGAVVPDTDSCEPPVCAAGGVAATVGGVNGSVPVQRLGWGSVAIVPDGCEGVNPRYSGDVVATCGVGGTVLDLTGCTGKPCAAESVDVAVGRGAGSIDVQAMVHGGTQVVAEGCAAAGGAGFEGALVMRCDAMEVVADTSACIGQPCAVSTVDATLASSTANVPSPALAHNTTASLDGVCSTVDSRFTGDLLVECYAGVLTVDATPCVGLPCAVDVAGLVQNAAGGCESISSGASCVPQCAFGFAAQGEITCDLGVVSSTATCVPMGCAEPPSFQMLAVDTSYRAAAGHSHCANTPHNRTCALKCKEGFAAASELLCAAGSFSLQGDAPHCVPVCADVPQLMVANAVQGWAAGCRGVEKGCDVLCEPGWHGAKLACCSGAFRVGSCDGPAPDAAGPLCTAASCGSAPPLRHGDVSACNNLGHDETCSPSCESGTVVTGEFRCSFGRIVGVPACLPPGAQTAVVMGARGQVVASGFASSAEAQSWGNRAEAVLVEVAARAGTGQVVVEGVTVTEVDVSSRRLAQLKAELDYTVVLPQGGASFDANTFAENLKIGVLQAGVPSGVFVEVAAPIVVSDMVVEATETDSDSDEDSQILVIVACAAGGAAAVLLLAALAWWCRKKPAESKWCKPRPQESQSTVVQIGATAVDEMKPCDVGEKAAATATWSSADTQASAGTGTPESAISTTPTVTKSPSSRKVNAGAGGKGSRKGGAPRSTSSGSGAN